MEHPLNHTKQPLSAQSQLANSSVLQKLDNTNNVDFSSHHRSMYAG